MQLSERTYNRITRIAFMLILLTGIGLRCYQYLMGRSLWEDEAHLALNFISRNYLTLFKPLDYLQAAPPLFLLSVKTFAVLFGYNAYALRALPFLASLLTLPLFYFILLQLTRSRIAALLGFFAFSVNLAVIHYSSELKTYGVDVAVYLLLVYFTLSQHQWVKKRRNFLLGLSGCLCMLYSMVAPFILFCIACYLLLGWYRNKKIQQQELKVLVAWAVVLLSYYFGFVYHHPYAIAQRENYTFAFPPLPFFSARFNHFMAGSLQEICFNYLLYVSKSWGFAYVLLSLFLIAIIHALYQKHYALLLLACMPILLHFLLAAFQVYPFWYRLILYFIPPLIILMSYGAVVVARFIAVRLKTTWITGTAVMLLFGYFFTEQSIRNFPLYYREVRPVLDHINKHYPNTYIYITTPYTLYKYYQLTGYARDTLYQGLPWNIGPEQYYEAVNGAKSDYLLLHATDPHADGYQQVLEDLRKKKLIGKEFSYMTYTISEVKVTSTGQSMNYLDFDREQTFDLNGKKVVAIWSNQSLRSHAIHLDKGRYVVRVITQGTPVQKIFPHITILINGKKLADFYTPESYSPELFPLNLDKDGDVVVELVMDNDATDTQRKEDRNAFIQSIIFEKQSTSGR